MLLVLLLLLLVLVLLQLLLLLLVLLLLLRQGAKAAKPTIFKLLKQTLGQFCCTFPFRIV